MSDKLNELLSQHPEFERLADETEKMRDTVDSHKENSEYIDALKVMIDIDTNMLALMDYHVRLSTECLKLDRG